MQESRTINFTVIVAALGYFVDMYDISLFGIVRIPSLQALGITEQTQLLQIGTHLINMQMIGMLVGGILWGIIGDKRGRLSVLFGSILIYSVANIANAFVVDVQQYAILRFIAGVGLAGELGAAVTLVSEVMSKEKRGYGTTIVATLGLAGSATAALVGGKFSWQTAYLVGGVMGLLLLLLRFNVAESLMFKGATETNLRRGDLRLLLEPRSLIKYFHCILLGTPIWFTTGLLITFSPEFARNLNVTEPIKTADAVLYVSVGLVLGDLLCGLLSQFLKSRKKALGIFILGLASLICVYLTTDGMSKSSFLLLCFGLGLFAGYWSMFVTVAAEQFGTNIRATVATTVPNFVRASVVLINYIFAMLVPTQGPVVSAMWIGGTFLLLAVVSLLSLNETFGKSLDFVEGMGVKAKLATTDAAVLEGKESHS